MKVTQTHDMHTGSSFSDFLDEQGIRNEVEASAIKRVLAWQFQQAMEQQKKTKQAMARDLKTSRSQVARLLDPANTAISLDTISRAADVLGKQLVFELRDLPTPRGPKGKRSISTRHKPDVSAKALRSTAA